MFFNIIRISFESLKSNLLRTFLTMLGIIIGISSIIAFITIGEGVTYAVIDQLSGLGGNIVTVSITNTTVKAGFTDGELNKFAQIGGTGGISPTISQRKYITLIPERTNSVYDDNRVVNSRVMGINDFYFSVTAKNGMLFGRSINDTDIEFSTNVCVLGYDTWSKLYGNYNPVGEVIKISNIEFTIVGVMDSLVGVSTLGNISVMVPYTVAVETLGMGLVKTFDIVVTNSDDMKNVVDAADTLCALMLNDNDASDYTVINQQEVMDIVVSITDLALGMLAGIAAITLLVGGIGIMNMMLVTVTERTTEIGLRKALGAKPATILLQFLTESVIISLLGGIIGVLLGLGLSWLASALIGYTFSFKYSTIFASTGFSFAVGVIFGILPARRAAKLNPIDALRSV